MTFEMQKLLNKLDYDWFKGLSAGWCFADYFRLPLKRQFITKNGQKASVVKVIFERKDEQRKLFDIEIQDSDGARVRRSDCNEKLYDYIITEIKAVCEEG